MQSKNRLYAIALAAIGILGVCAGDAAPAFAAPRKGYSVSRRTGKTYRTYTYKGRTRRYAVRRRPAAPRSTASVKVQAVQDGTRLILTGAKAFRPTVQTLKTSQGIMVSVPGTFARGSAGNLPVKSRYVSSVRYGHAPGASPATFVVARTKGELSYSTSGSPDRKRWEITLWNNQASGASPAKPAAIATAAPVSLAAPKARLLLKDSPVRVAMRDGVRPMLPGSEAPSPVVQVPVSVKAAAVSRLASPAPAPLKKGVSLEAAAEKRISLDFVAADINDVLKALSLQSGVNIVTGADVKGVVTVQLQNVTVTEALDMIARLSSFRYARFGPAFVVGTEASVKSITDSATETTAPEPVVTEFIPYRYTSQGNMTRLLSERFPSIKFGADTGPAGAAGAAGAAANPSSQQLLVVTETPKKVEEVRAFVQKLEQAISLPTVGASTEVYLIKYASPGDLIAILARLVPTLSVQTGPTQGFKPDTTGASAAFSTGAVTGPAQGGTGSGGGAGTPGGTGGSVGATTAGAAAPAALPLTLLITGAPADIVRAREVLAQIDVKVPQMVFEARVVDLSNTDRLQLGLSYEFGRPVEIGERSPGITAPTVGGGLAPAQGTNLAFGNILRTPYSIGVTPSALQQLGNSRILARPNISALDGQPATVFIGDQIKYVVNIQQTPQGQNIQTETATVGITLKVTGKASPDGTITLYVHPEVSTITTFLNLGNGISLPQIATRYVDTTIRVKDGETIGIGGLIQDTEISTLRKVPLLGDIPFFGQLFRSRDRQKNKSELVILLTSRVIRD